MQGTRLLLYIYVCISERVLCSKNFTLELQEWETFLRRQNQVFSYKNRSFAASKMENNLAAIKILFLASTTFRPQFEKTVSNFFFSRQDQLSSDKTAFCFCSQKYLQLRKCRLEASKQHVPLLQQQNLKCSDWFSATEMNSSFVSKSTNKGH